MADHYLTLGVARTATRREIDEAYRTLTEPATGGARLLRVLAVRRRRQIEIAYRTLRDERARARYDRLLAPSRPSEG